MVNAVKNKEFSSYVVSKLDLIMGLSRIVDLVNPYLSDHHQRVAYIAGTIARECGFSEDDVSNAVAAAALHDIGVVAEKEFRELTVSEYTSNEFGHGYVGYLLFRDIDKFGDIAEPIRYHHVKWSAGKDDPAIPEISYILHLADRVDILMDRKLPALEQKKRVTEKIAGMKGIWFKPAHVDALLHAAEKESFWFNIEEPDKFRLLRRAHRFHALILETPHILSISKLISRIIDFRCSFTSTHSAGVAKSAAVLARLCGMDEASVENIEIAGYLHDLGKLAIMPDILYKKGPLTLDEMRIIKKHTYYTYFALNSFEIFDHIKEWASFHHETIDGNGYPFHVNGDRLDLGCRIMAVADIFTALTEERPYRKGMGKEDVLHIIVELSKMNKLDSKVVKILEANYDYINAERENVQISAAEAYNAFSGELSSKGLSLFENHKN
jgi:HD-GYP domain-containing protein (c-di-GMP phosphodiesterase class II)